VLYGKSGEGLPDSNRVAFLPANPSRSKLR
jgi:hypothetical protein